jgi:hypothetical protein
MHCSYCVKAVDCIFVGVPLTSETVYFNVMSELEPLLPAPAGALHAAPVSWVVVVVLLLEVVPVLLAEAPTLAVSFHPGVARDMTNPNDNNAKTVKSDLRNKFSLWCRCAS